MTSNFANIFLLNQIFMSQIIKNGRNKHLFVMFPVDIP